MMLSGAVRIDGSLDTIGIRYRFLNCRVCADGLTGAGREQCLAHEDDCAKAGRKPGGHGGVGCTKRTDYSYAAN